MYFRKQNIKEENIEYELKKNTLKETKRQTK